MVCEVYLDETFLQQGMLTFSFLSLLYHSFFCGKPAAILWTLKQYYGDTHMGRNWGLLLRVMWANYLEVDPPTQHKPSD